MVDGEDALHHAAAEAKAVQGHAAQEVLVLHIVLEVQVEAKAAMLAAARAAGEAGADGQAALYHAAAELRQGQGDAVFPESAQEVQANQGRDAILNRAILLLLRNVAAIHVRASTSPTTQMYDMQI